MMVEHVLRAEILRPSKLDDRECDLWREMQERSPSLRRAFLTPTFAKACEQANGRSYVAVLHQGGRVCGFFPFQFRSFWHQSMRLAERIGGGPSDAAGLIAEPELRITGLALLRLAGLSSLALSHLVAGQEQFGLDAEWSQMGHTTDISDGPDAYFAALLQRDRLLVRDTERRMRKAASSYGELRFTRHERIPADLIAHLVAQKRQQYQRTQTGDVFARGVNLRLIDAMNEMSAPDCRLVMSRLEAGDRVLAQHIGPQYHDVLSHWFPVYDPEARNVSPGRLLLWQMIQRAGEDGIRLIDYGEGDALYKREFSTGVARYGVVAWSTGDIRSVVARTYQGLEWRVRMLRRRLQNQTAASV